MKLIKLGELKYNDTFHFPKRIKVWAVVWHDNTKGVTYCDSLSFPFHVSNRPFNSDREILVDDNYESKEV